MRKRHGLAALALGLLLILPGCRSGKEVPGEVPPEEISPEVDSPADGPVADQAVVAGIGTRQVTWAQYRLTFETYLQYYKELGFDVFATEERLQGFQERTVEALLQPYVLADQAERQGLDQMTAEQEQNLARQIDEAQASLGESYAEQVAAEAAQDPALDTGARTRELIAAESYYYTGVELSYEAYLDWIAGYCRDQYLIQLLREATVESVSVTEEEIRTYYDKAVAADQSTYSMEPGRYKEACEAAEGLEPLFVPEGYSRILVLFYPIEGLSENTAYTENLQQMEDIALDYGALAFSEARDQEDHGPEKAALLKEYRRLEQENQDISAEAAAPALAQAKEAYDQLASGIPFAELTDAEPALISLSHESGRDWSETVKSAFSELEVGTYSGVVQDETGCYLLYYLADEPAGIRSYETVQEQIHAQLLEAAQETAWQEQIEIWMADEAITRDEALVHAMGVS